MARKRRVVYPNYFYHVMIRGVGGRDIFEDNQDRSRFCLLLQYASETSKFSIHGFCLMSNHVHLLLQPHTEDLSSGMHRLTFRYAQYYNKKVERQGYLFQSRYKSVAIQDGIYLRRLIRYIHCNPVRANLINNPSNYAWSSHQSYIGDSKFGWLKTDSILSLFNSEPNVAIESFQSYIYKNDMEAKAELDEIRFSTETGAYGNCVFVQTIKSIF